MEESQYWGTSLLTDKCYISISFNDAFMVFSLIGTKKEEEKVAVGLRIQKIICCQFSADKLFIPCGRSEYSWLPR